DQADAATGPDMFGSPPPPTESVDPNAGNGGTGGDGIGVDLPIEPEAPVNFAPEDLVLSSGGSVLENAIAGTVVARFSGIDANAGETLTYSLINDAGGLFAIDPASGEVTVADGAVLDLEAAASHDIVVEVTDAGGLSHSESFTIDLENVNEGPVDLALSSGGAVLENAAAGTVVAQITGTDPDAGDVLSYSLADDAGGLFAIDPASGEVTVAEGAVLDHQVAASHDVTVRVTDAAGESYDEVFTIAVTDVNEAPTDLDVSGIADNLVANGSFESATSNGRTTSIDDWSFVSGNSVDTWHESSAQRWLGGADNVDGNYHLDLDAGGANARIAQVIDGLTDGETYQLDFSFADYTTTYRGASSGGMNVYWNGELVETVGGEGGRDLVDYSLELVAGSGDGSGRLEFEGTGTVDGWGAGLDNVRLTAANPAPTVAEDAETGTVVATATAVDPENAGDLTFSLDDDADGRFTIDPETGEIKVADAEAIDYESATSHDITVRVTDADGESTTQQTSITVADDGNAAPVEIGVGASKTIVLEDFESGATGWSDNTTSAGGGGLDGNYLGNFGGTNGEQAVYKIFELSGEQDSVTINFDFLEFDTWNGEEFKIWVDDQLVSTDTYYTQQFYGQSDVSTYGTETSRQSSNLAHWGYNDQTHSYELTINTTSDSIKVGFGADLDEIKLQESWGIDNFQLTENSTGTTINVDEDVANGASLGTVGAVDPENAGRLTYSLDDDAAGRFAIDSESGEITVVEAAAIDFENDPEHSIMVRVTDADGEFSVQEIAVNVNDIYDNDATSADDKVEGGRGDDELSGLAGNDVLYGYEGDDDLSGGDGSDRLEGGAGDDVLHGGAGDDTLSGGDGADHFLIIQGQGNDSISGGTGAWTDIIDLQSGEGDDSIGNFGTDWTVDLSSGEIDSSSTDGENGWLDLTDDAAGTITLQDGTEIDFEGIEHIQW
ncbi:MAG: cadherin domain-containing protein, partial [Geminicoccaceae bacterium]